MVRFVVAAVMTAVMVAATGCGRDPSDTERHVDRLGTAGTSLTLDGRPWWPAGLNAYQLGTDWRVNAGCGSQVDLDAYFGALPPNTLTRFNAYSSLVVDKNTGQLDFAPLDAVFDAAARHDQLLDAVLTNSEGICEKGGFKGSDWFRGRWQTDVLPGEPMSYADWIETAVKRWGDSPAAVAWTPVGEPEPSTCASPDCDWRSRQCPADAAGVLRRFIDEVGPRIKRLDPEALVFGGRAGGGQCGGVGDEYAFVGASSSVDVLEYHDYEVGDELPGDPRDGLQRRLQQARELDKPLVVAELGVYAGSCMTLPRRHDVVADTVGRLREAGAAGVLFWSFVPDARLGECTYDIGPDDPILQIIHGG